MEDALTWLVIYVNIDGVGYVDMQLITGFTELLLILLLADKFLKIPKVLSNLY